jgi:hypothetical protein
MASGTMENTPSIQVLCSIFFSDLNAQKKLEVFPITRPGQRLHSYGKIHHVLMGKLKTHYFYGHFQ